MLYPHGLLVKRLAAALMPCRTWLMMYRKVSVCLTGTCFSALLAYMCNTKPCANSCRLVSRLPVCPAQAYRNSAHLYVWSISAMTITDPGPRHTCAGGGLSICGDSAQVLATNQLVVRRAPLAQIQRMPFPVTLHFTGPVGAANFCSGL